MSKWLMLTVALVGACGDNLYDDNPATVVRVDAESNGPNCPAGGAAVHSGHDLDNDAYLDDEEITGTQYVCNAQINVQCQGGTIIPGPVTVRSNADAAGLRGVHCVDGNLLITGVDSAGLADLRDLSVVTGDTILVGNGQLDSLAGLGNLREVGGTLLLQSNEALIDLMGLDKFRRAYELTIVGNPELVTLAGLDSITTFPGEIRVINNPKLTELTGLQNMTSVERSISIRGNPSLVSLSGFAGLQELNLLEVAANPGIAAIDLPVLRRTRSRLLFNDNAALAAIKLPTLVAAGGFVQINNNAALQAIEMPQVSTLNGFYAHNNTTLPALSLPALTYVTGVFELRDDRALTSLVAPNLVSVGADFVLAQTKLANFDGLPTLTSIGGNAAVINNPSVSNSAAMSWLAGVAVAGSTTVSGNGAP